MPILQSPEVHGTSTSSIVVFGDRYSDEGRFPYFLQHDGYAPPTGTLIPESLKAADDIDIILADKEKNVNVATGESLFDPVPSKDYILYTVFIGANDITVGSIFIYSQVEG
ncbi:MAG: hypothetical protein Q9159_002428 [Coniocarpon cinnabarinum]